VLFAYALFVRIPTRLLVAFALFAGNWGMTIWPGMPAPLYPLWSVSVEEQFYLVWPLLLSAVPRRRMRLMASALIVVAVLTRAGLFASGVHVGAVWLNTAAHLDAIGVGALVALGGRVRLVPGAGTVWHTLLVPAPIGAPMQTRAGASVWASLAFLGAVLACGGVLIAALAGEGSWLSRPALVYLGRISYGLYIYHGLALAMTESWVWPPASAFALTLVAAAVSYHAYERPFLRLKRRFERVSFASDVGHTPASAGVRAP
jgi:peptidoglycan/LPS O-acetylase OafA/YrhL